MKLGAQLYTVRDFIQTEADIRRTMKKVANMGYTTVQVSAIGKMDPCALKEICDENQLKIVLTHSDVNRILHDTENLVREHEILDCPYIGLGAMPDKYRNSYWIDYFAEDFREPIKKIAAAGKKFMYHNHHFEFEKTKKGRLIEWMLDTFSPDEFGITLDTYWVAAAGGDVIWWIEQMKEFIPCVHLKDMAVVDGKCVMAPVLEGNLNFKGILEKLEELECTDYLLVEQDTCQGSPFDALQTSYRNLNKLGYL